MINKMNLIQRYRRLNFWNQLSAWAAVITILSFLLYLLYPQSSNHIQNQSNSNSNAVGNVTIQVGHDVVINNPLSSDSVRKIPATKSVHGFLPRKGRIEKEAEVVFSEDAYHSQFIDPFSWSNLIQLNKLSQNTCLFLGLSFTVPNLRRLLDVSNRKNPSRTLNHYIVKKMPNFSNNSDTLDQLAFLLEEQDANELGLNVVWVEEFSSVAQLLKKIGNTNA